MEAVTPGGYCMWETYRERYKMDSQLLMYICVPKKADGSKTEDIFHHFFMFHFDHLYVTAYYPKLT